MNSSAIHTAKTVVSGNAVLCGKMTPDAFDSAACEKFVKIVQFRAQADGIMAISPSAWLASLGLSRAGLRLRLEPEVGGRAPIWCGFARWLIEAGTPWESNWNFEETSDRRGWVITFEEIAPLPPTPTDRDLDSVSDDLALTLTEIAEFSDRHGLGFAAPFHATRDIVRGADAAPLDGLPEGLLSPTANRLMRAAASANFFTGMGNWGDNFHPPAIMPDYSRLTERLFLLLSEGLIGAANTSARP